MRNKHITKFGDPTTAKGTTYYVTDQEGVFQMSVDMEFARLYQEGIIVTPLMESRIIDRVKREQLIYHSRIAQMGIPDKLKTLLKNNKKSDVEKYSKKFTLSEIDLFLLIHNCNQINFKHESKFPEYVPDHLTITENDRSELKSGNFKPFTKKITPLLKERRRIHVHLFQQEMIWHCFYFSYDDINTDDKNHWKYGCHLHYVSYLWQNHSKEDIWGAFDKRTTEIGGNLHIRFFPFEYPETNELTENDSANQIKFPPWVFDFDSDFVFGNNITPSPTLQTTTRGFWSGQISTRPEPNA
jgi:hypothetical protein